ncbi:MAG: asparagine synthase (glutamine-hydrolyzing) [Planctomycetota bacterium]|jgi:asparagine synthase (glutamine-hydrolysing)
MCGLAGIAYNDPGRTPEVALLKRMTDSIVHRGPDDEGFHTDGPFGLGFRRLSIIDLKGGHQPLANETDDVWVVLNGEIYNHRELRRGLEEKGHVFRTASDTEVLVHLYEEKGADLVDDLVGMFAFAIIDRRGGANRLLIARDRLGIKPLYWMQSSEGIAFGSEAKELLALEWTNREMRQEKLLDYLVRGYVGGPDSAWAGIQRLSPGCRLTWSPGQDVQIERYWDLPLEGEREPADSEEILEWLDRCVSDRLISDVPLGAFLSGGVDSTAVVTSMKAALGVPPVVCSVGFQERSHDELEIAKATAERLGLTHHTQILEADPQVALDVLPWFYDEPLADPSTLPTWLVSKMAREHVTVALSGDGGDETFGGYRRYVHDVAENRLRSLIGTPGRGLARALGSIYPKLDWAPRFLRGKTFLTNVGDDPARAYFRSVAMLQREDALAILNPELARHLASHDPFEEFVQAYDRPRGVGSLYRAQYADFHTYLPDQILAKVDRASMAVSLEVRVPILDHRFVGRFANLPANQKVRAGRGKHAFRESLRGRLPGEVLDGTKRGFDTPLAAWLRGPMRSAARTAVEELPADWFDRTSLRRVFSEHISGGRDHGRLLWSLIVLDAWRRRHGVRGLVA